MQDFLTFASSILGDMASFLMTEPVIYFVGLFVLVMVGGLVKSLLTY